MLLLCIGRISLSDHKVQWSSIMDSTSKHNYFFQWVPLHVDWNNCQIMWNFQCSANAMAMHRFRSCSNWDTRPKLRMNAALHALCFSALNYQLANKFIHSYLVGIYFIIVSLCEDFGHRDRDGKCNNGYCESLRQKTCNAHSITNRYGWSRETESIYV